MAEVMNHNSRGRPLRYTYSEDFLVGWIRRSLTRDPRKPKGKRMCIVCTFIVISLILYFLGGFLFVASYNKKFPITGQPVGPTLATVLLWVGPTIFFLGLIGFVLFFATLCNDIGTSGDD